MKPSADAVEQALALITDSTHRHWAQAILARHEAEETA